MTWTPAPDLAQLAEAQPTVISIELPGHVATRFEAVCDAISTHQPADNPLHAADIVTLIGMAYVEQLMRTDNLHTIFEDDRNERP